MATRFILLFVLAVAASCDGTARALTQAAVAPEYIVIGSGAGGGTLAARLARAGHSVLLLEAGEDVGGKLQYQVPAMHALSTEDADLAWWFWVKHNTDDAVDRADSKHQPEGILYPRGSALGGSTAVNAMVTVLPTPSDWDRLAALTGDPTWRAANMGRYETRVREWLPIEFADPKLALGDEQVTSFLTAAAQTYRATSTSTTAANLSTLLSHDVNQALRSGEAGGLFRLPLATQDGHRRGTRERVLDTVAEGFPLAVRTGAFVTRVLWDEHGAVPTAIGVEYVQGAHVYAASLKQQPAPRERLEAFASREVILAAGAFNSPQLLMLSGVGEAASLKKLGVPVQVDRPGVGHNLQDRYEAPVVHELPKPVSVLAGCQLGVTAPDDPCLDDWRAGQGVYRTPGFLAAVLMKSSQSTTLADLQVFAVPSDARGYYPGYSRDTALARSRFTWLLLKAHTRNNDGVVSLRDASPFSRPDIHFHSYDERDPLNDPDLLALVEGVKFIRQMQQRLVDTTATEVWPGPQVQRDVDLATWIRKESWGHHACCTNRMGHAEDAQAVVDSRFRVLGTRRLRVVDASVFPEIPGTFIAFPIFMAAEHAADAILEDAR